MRCPETDALAPRHSPFAAQKLPVHGSAAMPPVPRYSGQFSGLPRATANVGNPTGRGTQWDFVGLRGKSCEIAEMLAILRVPSSSRSSPVLHLGPVDNSVCNHSRANR